VDKSRWYKDPTFDKKTVERLHAMKLLCFNILDMEEKKAHPNDKVWTMAAIQTACSLGYHQKGSQKPGKKKSEHLCRWLRLFIEDREEVPTCNWDTLGRSLIDDDDFAQEIHAYLQTLGPYFSTESIVQFIDTPEMLAWLSQKKTISVAVAQRWLQKMGYWWTLNPKGQYVDGHECPDVVAYRDGTFLPTIAKLEKCTRKYGSGDWEIMMDPNIHQTVIISKTRPCCLVLDGEP